MITEKRTPRRRTTKPTLEEIRATWDGGLVPNEEEIGILFDAVTELEVKKDKLWSACDRITLLCDVFDDKADEMQTIAAEALEDTK